eukprot:6797297-Alexandrium_andersonii.AAC.1
MCIRDSHPTWPDEIPHAPKHIPMRNGLHKQGSCFRPSALPQEGQEAVSYTHLRAHETSAHL